MAIRIGVTSMRELTSWLDAPLATSPLPGGQQLYTWSRPPEALSIAVDANGRVVAVSAAGGPPW
jgi:hypothetical protein